MISSHCNPFASPFSIAHPRRDDGPAPVSSPLLSVSGSACFLRPPPLLLLVLPLLSFLACFFTGVGVVAGGNKGVGGEMSSASPPPATSKAASLSRYA